MAVKINCFAKFTLWTKKNSGRIGRLWKNGFPAEKFSKKISFLFGRKKLSFPLNYIILCVYTSEILHALDSCSSHGPIFELGSWRRWKSTLWIADLVRHLRLSYKFRPKLVLYKTKPPYSYRKHSLKWTHGLFKMTNWVSSLILGTFSWVLPVRSCYCGDLLQASVSFACSIFTALIGSFSAAPQHTVEKFTPPKKIILAKG